MNRQCGDCQLCCKLVPVKELNKKAGQRCKHQKFKKGCMIYHQPNKGFPSSCALWNCAWLVDEYAADLSRPDRSHYVVDIMPDFVTLQNKAGEDKHIGVIQVWCDPAYPTAHRDPALRAYIERRSQKEHIGALVRFDEEKAIFLAPPALTQDDWFEKESTQPIKREHSIEELAEFFNLELELRNGPS